jgi:hypothetical protein
MAKGKSSSSNLATSQSSPRILTAFSPIPDGESGSTLFFAQAQLAVDSDTIRVFDCKNGGQCTARWSSSSAEQQARVTAITWAFLSPSTQTSEEKATRGKKRRKSSTSELQDAASTLAAPAASRQPQPVLCIGLSNGSILLLHPKQSSVVAKIAVWRKMSQIPVKLRETHHFRRTWECCWQGSRVGARCLLLFPRRALSTYRKVM